MRHNSPGTLNRGLVFIISAPAGTGKTTLVRMLCEEFDRIVESVSYTTRKIRPKEEDGKDYHFVSEEEFEEKIKQSDFLEYARVFGHYYGTSGKDIEELVRKGKHVVLIIDTQGALQLMGKIEAVFIFISPPDFEELRSRLVTSQIRDEGIDRREAFLGAKRDRSGSKI